MAANDGVHPAIRHQQASNGLLSFKETGWEVKKKTERR